MSSQRRPNESIAAWLSSLPSDERARQLRTIASTDQEIAALEYNWRFWARPNQIAPEGPWSKWLLLAGRGMGKTRSGGEWIRERVASGAQHLILAGATAGDVRDIMVEGESGILAISPPWDRPRYEPSKGRLTWKSGAKALLMSADEPDRFRGKQCDTFWADELASWRTPVLSGREAKATQIRGVPESWTQLALGARLGAKYGVRPKGVVSTTPRGTKVIRDLIADKRTIVTRGSTFENAANLAPEYLAEINAKYEGTRLGRQELYAEVLDDVEGALWSRDLIEETRVRVAPEMRRIVVAIDPAVTNHDGSDETGIVVAGLGVDSRGYVLADLSGRMSPDQWARQAVQAFDRFGADRIIAEQNNGGMLVEHALRTVRHSISYSAVHASQGKRTRAEPIAALYEQKKISHVGMFPKLEDQLCSWEPLTGAGSPDRLDALVWALSELAFGGTVRRDFSHLPPR